MPFNKMQLLTEIYSKPVSRMFETSDMATYVILCAQQYYLECKKISLDRQATATDISFKLSNYINLLLSEISRKCNTAVEREHYMDMFLNNVKKIDLEILTKEREQK